jgi:hypothetical protein
MQCICYKLLAKSDVSPLLKQCFITLILHAMCSTL